MHYKVLFLAMSCNDPFFEISRKVVHDTWAKDIIMGEYPEYGFYSYTSSNTGKECIENNTIYLNAKDTIHDTFDKTVRCFQFLKDNEITFDYVVRTNTSIYFNIPNTISFVNTELKIFNIDFYSSLIGHLWNAEINNYIHNFFGGIMIMSNRFIETILKNIDNYNKDHETIKQITSQYIDDFYGFDDVIISCLIYLFEKDNIFKTNLFFSEYYVPRYKTIPLNKVLVKEENLTEHLCFGTDHYYSDPNIINEITFVQYRMHGAKKHKNFRYIELEHAYELDNANNSRINRD